MPDFNILVVSPNFYPATRLGGPVAALYGLCRQLCRLANVRVLTTDARGDQVSDRLSPLEQASVDEFSVFYAKRVAGMSCSGQLLWRLPSLVRWADVVYLNYVYSFPTLPTLIACAMFRKPVLWACRGALQSWAGSTRPVIKRPWHWLCNMLLDPRRCLSCHTGLQSPKA